MLEANRAASSSAPGLTQALADRLPQYDATALAQAISARALSSLEVVEAHFTRIDRLNAKYNALVTLDRQRALARARDADRALAQGDSWGPLHGVPVTIKDCFETAGLGTTVGAAKHARDVPDRDAWVVAKLKQAGAIVLGKTNCATWCADVQTNSEMFGATNNPWDVTRTAGGSSGGEAAAVALGLSPLGIGSDSNGGIRIPAAYCGVFGLKTTIGKISRQGLRPASEASYPVEDSLTVVGWLARSVRDLMLCQRVFTGERFDLQQRGAPPRIKWSTEWGIQPVDDEVSSFLGDALAAAVARGTDIKATKSPLRFDGMSMHFMRLSMAEFVPYPSSSKLHRLFAFGETLRSVFGGDRGSSYRALKREQNIMTAGVAAFLEDCDAWVLPATPSTAFPHHKSGRPLTLDVNGRPTQIGYWSATTGFTYPLNVVGSPSVIVPAAGMSARGLPIALQLVGKRGWDMRLLHIAAWLSELLGTPAPKSISSARESSGAA